jgi:hypothetical protein
MPRGTAHADIQTYLDTAAKLMSSNEEESWIAVFVDPGGRTIGPGWTMWRGHRCPLEHYQPMWRGMLQVGQRRQAAGVVGVRYHPHPWRIPADAGTRLKTIDRLTRQVGMRLWDHITLDSLDEVFSVAGVFRRGSERIQLAPDSSSNPFAIPVNVLMRN